MGSDGTQDNRDHYVEIPSSQFSVVTRPLFSPVVVLFVEPSGRTLVDTLLPVSGPRGPLQGYGETRGKDPGVVSKDLITYVGEWVEGKEVSEVVK